MSIVVGILTYTQRVWLVCFFFTTVTSQSCRESISSSTCILPEPQPNLEAGHLDTLWLEVRCMLGCIEKYEDDDMEVINDTTVWPTMNFKKFDEECTLYQKIRECKEGCQSRNMHVSSTINRCRDSCYSNCLSGITCRTCQDLRCPRFCRKTYCRFGCEVYDEINRPNEDTNSMEHPPSPAIAPTIIPTSASAAWKNWLYNINTEPALLAASQNSTGIRQSYSRIAYLIRISTSENVFYIWQKKKAEPLDLSPFACSTISVSFAVLSKYTKSSAQQMQFSPAVSLCVSGGFPVQCNQVFEADPTWVQSTIPTRYVGGYPNQLDKSSLHVTYMEDLREKFLGYSIANISWSLPNNSYYLMSYTIRVYPDHVRCGGLTDVVFTFTDINKEFTSFSLQTSEETNGLWRFGCTYLIEVVSIPTVKAIGKTIGTYISSTTELSNEFPLLMLNCTRVWDEQGHFSISVRWGFNDFTQTSHITRYHVAPTLQVGSRRDNIVRIYNSMFIQPHIGNYSVTTQTFVPQLNHSNFSYVVDVRSDKNESYYWRDIPLTESCTVPAAPLPPSIIKNISVSELEFNRTTEVLHLVVNLTPPDYIYGVFREYELILLTSHETCKDCEITQGQHFLSKDSIVEINTTITVNSSSHCLYLRARASNHYNLSGIWHEIIIPIDEECNTKFLDPNLNTSFISVIYEREDGTMMKVLDFGCAISMQQSSLKFNTDVNKIHAIYLKIQDITLRIQEFSQDHSIMNISSTEEQLTNIENKLNSIMMILGEQQKPEKGT